VVGRKAQPRQGSVEEELSTVGKDYAITKEDLKYLGERVEILKQGGEDL